MVGGSVEGVVVLVTGVLVVLVVVFFGGVGLVVFFGGVGMVMFFGGGEACSTRLAVLREIQEAVGVLMLEKPQTDCTM
jgi:hypothetical protein